MATHLFNESWAARSGRVIGSVTAVALIVLIIAIICAIPTWLLWNWLMPELFGLPQITIWQALGLLLLSKILFTNSPTKA